MELESLLTAEEQKNYDRLEKQGMSDQGIVSPEQLLEAGKKVYRKGKKAATKLVGEVKEGAKKLVKGATEMMSGKKEEK